MLPQTHCNAYSAAASLDTTLARTKDEAERLLAACNPLLRHLVLFMLHTGARTGELAGFRYTHVWWKLCQTYHTDTVGYSGNKTNNRTRSPRKM